MLIRLNNIIKRFKQGQNGNRNRAVLAGCQELGFSLLKIRKTLVDLNEINLASLGGEKVSTPTIYKVLNGQSDNHLAQELLSESLGLKRSEMFRDEVAK